MVQLDPHKLKFLFVSNNNRLSTSHRLAPTAMLHHKVLFIRVPEQITDNQRMVTNLLLNKLQSGNRIYTIWRSSVQ